MAPRSTLLAALSLSLVAGCRPLPDFVTCEEADACETTGFASTSGGETPTTSDGVFTATGDSPDTSSTAPAEETGDDPGSTTDEPVLPPQIVDGVVIPDYIDDNGLLSVEVTAVNTESVTMLLDDGELVELTLVRPGEFLGHIEAYTGIDNGKHTAVLTPSRDKLVGESVDADYVIALPKPGDETNWKTDGPEGSVAAISVLPDGRPVELGTYQEMGAPRCYLRLRDKKGNQVKAMDFVPLLGSAYCRAIDLKIDRDTGRMHVLVERESGEDIVWWAGEISAWGKGLKNIGIAPWATRPLPWRPGMTSSQSAARGQWRRSTSSTRSRCCCARASPRRRGCSTTDPAKIPTRHTHSRKPPATALSRATRSCSSARPTATTTASPTSATAS